MVRWFKSLWNDIKGNVKFSLLFWLFLGGGFTATVGFLYNSWQFLAHRPVTALEQLLALIVPFIVTCVAGLFLFFRPKAHKQWARVESTDQAKVKIVNTEPILKLALIPHGDNDSEVYLEVVNEGKLVDLSAQLRITKVSTGAACKKYGFDGQWKASLDYYDVLTEQTERSESSVSIETGKSRLLRIASIDSESRLGSTMEMRLTGISESIRWFFDPTANDKLPFFELEVRLLGKGYSSISKTYKVGPRTYAGPLQMMEVPA
jgi:hypothetical protein